MSMDPQNIKVGELRPSQVLTTFGIGSIIDLPNISVMVMGLEDWQPYIQDAVEISEERLLASVRQVLGPQVKSLRAAPIVPETEGFAPGPFEEASKVGIPVAPFPRWMVCPYCRRLAPLSTGLFKLEPSYYRPDLVRYSHANCSKPGKPPSVVPARFLVACKNGHLDDFPWVKFVHKGKTDCKWSLRLVEFGASGEAADIEVQCETCGASRRMSDAFRHGDNGLGRCRGRLPHLRDFCEGGCKDNDDSDMKQNAMLQGASNSWFPLMLSALAIPQAVNKLAQLVDDNWTMLEKVQSQQNIELLRTLTPSPLRDLTEYSDEDIWKAVEEKRAAAEQEEEESEGHADLKMPEWLVFSDPETVQRTRDFQLRVVQPPERYAEFFEKIVLAERLREVRGLIGFTRIESPADYDDPAAFPAKQKVPLSRIAPKWVPASEIRGEGIFFHFFEDKVQEWVSRKTVRSQQVVFSEAHKRWRMARGMEPPQKFDPGIRFVLLHSFAHALIRQLAVECGYTTASLRERIYSRAPGQDDSAMAGVLIYTAAPDSEGTLGGLVSLGEPQTLERHLDQALDAMRLCASDPLCAEHHPYRDGTTLHGASCHACLFAPETSCERGNKYLDRSVLVETVDRDDVAFFEMPSDKPLPEGAIDLFDLLTNDVTEPEATIKLPNDLAKFLGLPSLVDFRFLDDESDMPKKNTIVVVKDDRMTQGGETVQLACGKILWSRQVDVDTGETRVLVTIRTKGEPVKLRLSTDEWEQFTPLAVINQ